MCLHLSVITPKSDFYSPSLIYDDILYIMIYQTWLQCFLTLLHKLCQMKRSKTYLLICSFGETFKLFFLIAFWNQCHIAFDDNALDLHLNEKVDRFFQFLLCTTVLVYMYNVWQCIHWCNVIMVRVGCNSNDSKHVRWNKAVVQILEKTWSNTTHAWLITFNISFCLSLDHVS